ncbi:MAG: hypothetical protein MZW92_50055 [Comamonadaceae bacterium]|nr:hypothetical protein [Comamonadaceae bacterium]
MNEIRPAAVAGMFYPGRSGNPEARRRFHACGSARSAGYGRAPAEGAHRAPRRLRLFRARSRPAPMRGSRRGATRSGAS